MLDVKRIKKTLEDSFYLEMLNGFLFANGTTIETRTPSSSINTFETNYRNLNSYPVTLTYSGKNISSKTFTTPTGDIIVNYTYSGNLLTSISLSGAGYTGTLHTKTFTYSQSDITNITYTT